MAALTLIGLYKRPVSNSHGEASFWAPDQWGGQYVRRWLAGFDRALHDIPFRTTLITDTPSVLASVPCWLIEKRRVQAVPLHEFGRSYGLGWWAKVNVWRPDVSSGLIAYSDLDNVPGADIRPMLQTVSPDRPLWMLDDVLYPRMANGSTFIADADAPVLRALWTEYEHDPGKVEKQFAGWSEPPHRWSDQAFLATRVREAGFEIPYLQDVLPKDTILNARAELEKGVDWSACQFVFGSYQPKAHESTHPYYQKYWVDAPMEALVA